MRVQGGITIHALNARLAAVGLALENLGDIDAQSIAGAISTATHGTGARLRDIPSQVAALTLVLADGSTLRCSEQDDPELLRAARVGLGALGVVAEATLRCVPTFRLRGVNATAPLEQTLKRFEELSLANDHFEFYVFPHARTALTRTNNRTEEPARPRGRVSAYANNVLLTNHAFGLFCRLGRRMPAQIPRINRLLTRLAGASHRVDRSDRIFASPRLVRFTEMEYALPRERTVEAVRRVLELESRARGADIGMASPCPSRSRCALWPLTTRCSRPPLDATAGMSPCTCSRGWRGNPTSARSRRSWTSSAADPTGASATSRRPPRCARATPSGSVSRRCAGNWIQGDASPTTTSTACSGLSMSNPLKHLDETPI